ncbi:MAG: protein TolA, partial [Rhizobiales bacterium]|nr:protein TolA [Hyphomicrobiales bacterium]
ASLGAAHGTAATLSQSELDALRARLTKLWNVQAGSEHPEELIVDIRIRLTPDKRLAAPPEVVSRGSSPRYRAAADAAMRAVLQAQPYDMLRPGTYEQWKDMIVTFDPRQMFNG